MLYREPVLREHSVLHIKAGNNFYFIAGCVSFQISILVSHITNLVGHKLLDNLHVTNNLMTQSVGIHELISMLSNVLWGDFQSRYSFHVLCKSREAKQNQPWIRMI